MRRKLLLASVAAVAALFHPVAFANSNAGSKLYISPTPQPNEMAKADFEAITDWILIKALGNHGEAGSSTNFNNYDTWDISVIQKSKGLTDAGTPDIEVARVPTDPGQKAVRAAAKTNFNYAFKMVRNDATSVGGTGTIIYNRGLVAGPKRPFGRNEDFDIEVFTIGYNQEEIVVDPTTVGVAPTNTVVPAITGTAEVGEDLTASTGTFTGDAVITYAYQWFAGGVAIVGATTNTLSLTSDQLGKIITVRVAATNASGSAMAFSAPTTAVIA
ncbi:hypothetical protein [Mesorhizobium sp. M1A.F.Ca.ET.072.01.1.1]|uniref:hypothetical protein n=1 Tax=Mesorhizobium sp. M1A.F.Ca.ET.072.01.1.1 TaxID=2496753 RepID=UPI0016724609|nr:hypothetical protein [Mesorhizobium sp. M1A.F.Ca.ET.072.01.1.1]